MDIGRKPGYSLVLKVVEVVLRWMISSGPAVSTKKLSTWVCPEMARRTPVWRLRAASSSRLVWESKLDRYSLTL